MIDKSQAGSLIGQELRTKDGSSIGKIGQVYLDNDHGQPEWVTVNTGFFGTSESFVPLTDANLDREGGVSVPYTKDVIKDAPSIEDSGRLSEAEERDLYDHYDVSYGNDDGARQSVGTDTSVGTTDDAMTRSEERLDVGTEQVETGKARLRKWVETENVQVDVPVRTEKAALVSEPITDENRGEAFDGPAISEEEHVVTLNAERPVVSTETVPVERVRVDKQVEESVQTVEGEVRKERIDLDDEAADGRSETAARHQK